VARLRPRRFQIPGRINAGQHAVGDTRVATVIIFGNGASGQVKFVTVSIGMALTHNGFIIS
jgi:hypothetical protein